MRGPINGADAILGTLADLGVTVCFANPGTSEMHLVAALDREPRIKPVLCLFEGVATGAADGFARIAGVPAMTLLHLGPGYANGGANLHNARRAFSPIVNIVGDHATSHAVFDAPLASDIAAQAATSSIAVMSAAETSELGSLVEDAYRASVAAPGGPATLVVPADCAWSAAQRELAKTVRSRPLVDLVQVTASALLLRSATSPALLLGSHATRDEIALQAASRLAAAGVAVYSDTFVARQLRGGGRFEPRRLPYFGEDAVQLLAQHDLLILGGTSAPVSFFAYPDKPGSLVPAHVETVALCEQTDDVPETLAALADALVAPAPLDVARTVRPAAPTGKLTAATIGSSLARHMAEDCIVSDDGVTSSGPVFAQTLSCVRHDWLSLTGGAIGQGLPLAIGAAIARPGARVVALTGDGAAMYTPQALWTMAREGLDVTVIVFANRSYRILDIEYARTGSGKQGPAAAGLLGLGNPPLDWCSIASGMGVAAVSCDDAATFDALLCDALQAPGPRLIEARID